MHRLRLVQAQGNSAVLALNAKVAKLCEAHQGIEMQLGSIHTPYKAAVFESLTARGVQGAASGAQ